jgi:hypothetical protein
VEVFARLPDPPMFLPPGVDELITAKTPVGILKDSLDKIDIQALMCVHKAQ